MLAKDRVITDLERAITNTATTAAASPMITPQQKSSSSRRIRKDGSESYASKKDDQEEEARGKHPNAKSTSTSFSRGLSQGSSVETTRTEPSEVRPSEGPGSPPNSHRYGGAMRRSESLASALLLRYGSFHQQGSNANVTQVAQGRQQRQSTPSPSLSSTAQSPMAQQRTSVAAQYATTTNNTRYRLVSSATNGSSAVWRPPQARSFHADNEVNSLSPPPRAQSLQHQTGEQLDNDDYTCGAQRHVGSPIGRYRAGGEIAEARVSVCDRRRGTALFHIDGDTYGSARCSGGWIASTGTAMKVAVVFLARGCLKIVAAPTTHAEMSDEEVMERYGVPMLFATSSLIGIALGATCTLTLTRKSSER